MSWADVKEQISVKKTIRAVIFAVCLVLFLWQGYKIVAEYFQKEIATKVSINLLDSEKSRFDLAFCMDHINTLKQIELKNRTKLNLNYLEAYKSLEASSADFSERLAGAESLFRNVSEDVSIELRITYSDFTKENLTITNPATLYHPLFGHCSTISTSQTRNGNKIITSIIVDAKPSLNFFNQTMPLESLTRSSVQFPDDDDGKGDYAPSFATRFDPSPLVEERPELFQTSLKFSTFVRGQFYLTGDGVFAEAGAVEEVVVKQDVTDKNEVSFHPGDECSPDVTNEDLCLNACLVDRFISSAGCIHFRLKVMLENGMVDGNEKGRDGVKVCGAEDLKALARDTDDKQLDPGISLIQSILRGFGNSSLDDRCGCERPCDRRHFAIDRRKGFENTNQKDIQTVLLLDQRYFLYLDTPTFDFVRMLADVGGDLGLFLGYSAYSLADFVDFVRLLLKKKRQKAKVNPA